MARQLLHVVVETLDGRRPAAQLRGVLPPDACELIRHWIRLRQGQHVRYRMGTGRVCAVDAHAVEATAPIFEITGDGNYWARAVAVRLERHDDRWQCTVLRTY